MQNAMISRASLVSHLANAQEADLRYRRGLALLGLRKVQKSLPSGVSRTTAAVLSRLLTPGRSPQVPWAPLSSSLRPTTGSETLVRTKM